jgi:drug/metabolite transporter (DMT)-like permease
LIRVLALLGVLGISFSAIFLRLSGVSSVTAAFFRGFYALPGLVCLWLITRTTDTRPRGARWCAMVSGVFLALDLALWHQSILDIGAGLATVLVNSQVIFVGALAWAVHRERPSRMAIVFIPVVLAGVVLITASEAQTRTEPIPSAVWSLRSWRPPKGRTKYQEQGTKD